MNDITIQNEGETLDGGVELAIKAIEEARQSARKPKIAPATTAIPPEHADLQAALNAIPAGAKLEKHSASTAIGYGLRHAESGIPEDIGRALAAQWDQRTGGTAVSVFEGADPFYCAGPPVTTGSIYKLARQCGWTGPVSENDTDPHRNAPRPDEGCLYGLVGEVANTAHLANKEVNRFAAGLAFLTTLSTGLGRGCYMAIGDDWHHPRLFALHVGRSGHGRKGTSTKLATRIARALDERHRDVAFQRHTGGLSSREGVVIKIHDGYTEGKTEVPPVLDKRLWILESEFANVLHQSCRDGNTLSPALRDAWDGTCIKPATKKQPVYASNPHINMMGHITPSELLDLMKARELSNGFANRFLMIWAEQGELDPFPSYTRKEVIDSLADRVAEVLRFAGADRFEDRNHSRMELSTEAASRYAKLYRGELQDRRGGQLVAGLLTRRAPYLLRLAMIFALTDKTFTIGLPHLEAALHWVRYWADSVRFIFASAAEEDAFEKAQDTAQRIMEFLDQTSTATRTELSRQCFQGKVSKSVLDAAIDELLRANPPKIEVEDQPRKDGPGVGTKIYRKTPAKGAKGAKCGVIAGSVPEIESQRSERNERNEPELLATPTLDQPRDPQSLKNQPQESPRPENPDFAPQFAQFAQFAEPAKSDETQSSSLTSLNSLSSPGVSGFSGGEDGEMVEVEI